MVKQLETDVITDDMNVLFFSCWVGWFNKIKTSWPHEKENALQNR